MKSKAVKHNSNQSKRRKLALEWARRDVNNCHTEMAEELSDFIEASGLLVYDPVAIDSIYKKNPIRLLRRLWQTLLPIGLFLLGVGWEKLIGSLEKNERKTFRAKEFTKAKEKGYQKIQSEIVKKIKEAKQEIIGVEGRMQSEWVLVDCGDVVIHIMLAPARALYNLEELWSFDAPKKNQQEQHIY